ncbi:radical SAM protein [Candidatus Woesearchaeota archaeon]|nr:radical SAM protein [Candidatus Woesearchaeota archaeon]MBW3021578.1 radical SAM protein [Candidatus Woesearchaeota archaeon]
MMKEDIYTTLLTKVLTSKLLRKPLMKKLEKRMYQGMVVNQTHEVKAVQEKKYEFFQAMVTCALRNIDKGWISRDIVKIMIRNLVRNQIVRTDETKQKIYGFEERWGARPPSFLVFSPTQKCNLKCTGCYADSDTCTDSTLPFDVVEKVVDEAYNVWGNRFMVISGGEPFMYKDNGKTLLDIFEKYDQMIFLVYTNGTLITKEMAQRLAKMGNVSPALSVEGMEKETDERRGPGIFKRTLEAFQNLREAGVPFAISCTPTTKNYDVLMNDEFYEFYFEKQGATYMWQFQLMPVGRGKETFELMLNPQQRLSLYHKWKHVMIDKKYCVADFWNSGVLTHGCVAYGRHGGYMYIDWDGKIMPCVFVPYYEDNVLDLFKEGKPLAAAVFSDLMKRGRKWQDEYGLDDTKHPHNLLMPCSIRDHYENFRENILTPTAKAENREAQEALESDKYRENLRKFDEEMERLTEPLWQKEYMEGES